MSLINSDEAANAAAAAFVAAANTNMDLSGLTPEVRELVAGAFADLAMPDPMKAAFRALAENINAQLAVSIPQNFIVGEDGVHLEAANG